MILLIAIAVTLGAKAGGGEDYYKTLGIKRDANEEQIKKAFKKMAIRYHPDKNQDDPETAKE